MTGFSRRSGLRWWPLLGLLVIHSPVEAAQSADAQSDTARGPGAANRPAVTDRKPAWEWTLDERLTARFDPESMAAREAERQANAEVIRKFRGDRKAKLTEPRPLTESIIGSRAPELFLPTELFDTLLDEAYPAADRQASRDLLESKAAALGFGRDLWNRLEEAASQYLDLRYKQGPGGQIMSVSGKEDLRLCHERARALESAEAEFGKEAFFRLLYEVVAPDIQVGRMLGPGPPDYQAYEEKLRFREGGCQ